MKIKHVWTFSPQERKVRMVRMLSGRDTNGNFKNSLSVNLRPKMYSFVKECDSWFLTLMGVQFHWKTAPYGAFCLR